MVPVFSLHPTMSWLSTDLGAGGAGRALEESKALGSLENLMEESCSDRSMAWSPSAKRVEGALGLEVEVREYRGRAGLAGAGDQELAHDFRDPFPGSQDQGMPGFYDPALPLAELAQLGLELARDEGLLRS